MGAIQGAINQLVGTVAAGAVAGKHISTEVKQQKLAEAQNQAEIAATEERKAGDIKNLRNDTIEATEAISAHEASFNPTVGGKAWKDLTPEEKANLSPEQVNDLADQVERFREGTLTSDRIARMEDASKKLDAAGETEDEYKELKRTLEENKGLKPKAFKEATGMSKGDIKAKIAETNPKSRQRKAKAELKKAYEAFEELNDRIEATRTLRFNIKAATEKINRLQQGGKK